MAPMYERKPRQWKARGELPGKLDAEAAYRRVARERGDNRDKAPAGRLIARGLLAARTVSPPVPAPIPAQTTAIKPVSTRNNEDGAGAGDPKPCGRGVAPCSAASAVDATARAFHVIDTDLKPWEIAIVEVGVRWSQKVCHKIPAFASTYGESRRAHQ